MIVVLIIAVLLMIGVPNFVTARNRALLKSCVANLRHIDYAKEQYAMQFNKPQGDAVAWDDIVPGYIKSRPVCPTGSNYTLGAVGEYPTCPFAGHVIQ